MNSHNDLNLTIVYASDQSPTLKINTKTLNVNIQPWQNLTAGTYYYHIELYDAFKRYLPTSCLIQLDVFNSFPSQNHAPLFEKSLYEAQIVEQNAPNTLVVRVLALYPNDSNDSNDLGKQNPQLTYHFVQPNEIPAFQIESDTGQIYAKKILNREEKESYNFSVMAIDKESQLSCLVTVHVRVLPQAGKSPVFNKPQYSLSLPENMDVTDKPVVLEASAVDADNSSRIIYSLAGSLNDMNTFEVDATSGVLRLVSKLNYDLKNLYRLSIVARDLSQPPRASYAPLIVHIGRRLLNYLYLDIHIYYYYYYYLIYMYI